MRRTVRSDPESRWKGITARRKVVYSIWLWYIVYGIWYMVCSIYTIYSLSQWESFEFSQLPLLVLTNNVELFFPGGGRIESEDSFSTASKTL